MELNALSYYIYILYIITYPIMIAFFLISKSVPRGKGEGADRAAPSPKNKRTDIILW